MVALPAHHVRGVHGVRRLRHLARLRRHATTSSSRTSRRSTRRAWATACEGSSDFGQPFGWFPLSSALIILIFPLGFRLTCYYYRKAYYRSFWLSPPACAVAEPHEAYSGETRLPLIINNIHRCFWYAAIVVALILTYDALLAFGPMEGESDGIHMGLGTVILLANIVLIWLYTLSCHSCRHVGRRPAAALLQAPGPLPAVDLGLEAQRQPRAVRLALAVLRGHRRPLRLPALHRRDRGPEVLLMSRPESTRHEMTGNEMSYYAEGGIERHSYDVVIVGAGGAGLRAAIAAHEAGANTAIVCKSLLGKAHTVMAEGGIAAAMGNRWPEDNWEVHFRDTMRGGKMLNNWRMAQLHAQEAPERVLELEDWGALFDRTEDGLISQRDFGGHRYARLAHVGDRTGLEMIRTLQQRAVQIGIDVFMECTVTELLQEDDGNGGGRIAGVFGYWRETGRFVTIEAPAVILATGGIGKAYKVTSNSWEYTGDGHALALRAGAR